MKYLVTVAIAAYNIEQYIARCLESVLAQTFPCLEILVVDDASTDKTMAIVHDYQARHPRGAAIKIVSHDHNIGTGAVRNTAIDRAAGKYICFLDGDDYLEPEAISLLYRALTGCGAQMAVAGYKSVTTDGALISEWLPLAGQYNGLYAICHWVSRSGDIFPMMLWNKLYELSFLRQSGIRCRPEHRNEDIWASFQLLLKVTSCVFLHEKTINYVLRNNSHSIQVSDDRFYKQYKDIFNLILQRLAREAALKRPLPRALFDYFGSYCLHSANRIMNSPLPQSKKMAYLALLQTMVRPNFSAANFAAPHNKILYTVLAHHHSLTEYYALFTSHLNLHKVMQLGILTAFNFRTSTRCQLQKKLGMIKLFKYRVALRREVST